MPKQKQNSVGSEPSQLGKVVIVRGVHMIAERPKNHVRGGGVRVGHEEVDVQHEDEESIRGRR